MERIAVFCSASQDIDNIYAEKAHELGAWMGDNRKTLVYGGYKFWTYGKKTAAGYAPCGVEQRGKGSTQGVSRQTR